MLPTLAKPEFLQKCTGSALSIFDNKGKVENLLESFVEYFFSNSCHLLSQVIFFLPVLFFCLVLASVFSRLSGSSIVEAIFFSVFGIFFGYLVFITSGQIFAGFLSSVVSIASFFGSVYIKFRNDKLDKGAGVVKQVYVNGAVAMFSLMLVLGYVSGFSDNSYSRENAVLTNSPQSNDL